MAEALCSGVVAPSRRVTRGAAAAPPAALAEPVPAGGHSAAAAAARRSSFPAGRVVAMTTDRRKTRPLPRTTTVEAAAAPGQVRHLFFLPFRPGLFF
jgi:hypothetical protein